MGFLAGLVLKAAGIWGWLKNALGAVLGAIRAHPREAAIIALLCASVWLWRGWNGEQADHAATKLAHKAELQRWDDASAKALTDQLALFEENQSLNRRIVTDAQIRHAQIASATTSAIADYAASHRMRPGTCGVSPAATPAVPADPGAPLEPAPAADLVGIPRPEFDQLARAAVHGAEATVYLRDLVDSGLAVEWPEPAFGQ